MNICPICNGLIDFEKYCSKCGAKMEILERAEAYDDSYAPYLNYSLTDLNDGDPSDVCSHMSICRNCKNKEIVSIKNIVK